MTLIAVCGFQSSGKDTIGDYLCEHHNFQKDSFASPLKDACSSIFGWDREMLEGSSKEARIDREEVDTWWAERLDRPNWSPRVALQYMGTEVLRESFHNDIWLESFERRIAENSDKNIVVTDCRFGNELNLMGRLGATTIAVERGPRPDWWDYADAANSDTFLHAPEALEHLEKLGIHASEYSWVGRPVDHTIQNNSTINDLYRAIDEILKV